MLQQHSQGSGEGFGAKQRAGTIWLGAKGGLWDTVCAPQQVESYEYEPPSEIEEDEEIDEELAFTAEDKLKYGGWFSDGDGGSSDGGFDEGSEEAEEGEDVPERDSALDILYSDEELQVRAHARANRSCSMTQSRGGQRIRHGPARP